MGPDGRREPAHWTRPLAGTACPGHERERIGRAINQEVSVRGTGGAIFAGNVAYHGRALWMVQGPAGIVKPDLVPRECELLDHHKRRYPGMEPLLGGIIDLAAACRLAVRLLRAPALAVSASASYARPGLRPARDLLRHIGICLELFSSSMLPPRPTRSEESDCI